MEACLSAPARLLQGHLRIVHAVFKLPAPMDRL